MTKKSLDRLLSLAPALLGATLVPACVAADPAGDGATDTDSNAEDSDGADGTDGSATQVDERDGIPSSDFVDILHYYVSTQEDGPGLYAYRPAEPDAPPVYIDPNVTMSAPFTATFPIAATEGGSSLHLRPKGVLYNAEASFPPPAGEIPSVKTFVVTTDVAQLDSLPQQVSSHDYPGSFLGSSAYLAYGDSLDTSSIWFLIGNLRIDLDMTPEEAPLVLPEDGRLIGTMLGEGGRTHDHWLYIDADGTLKFYNEDFTTSTAVVDEDSSSPIENLNVAGGFVSRLGHEHMLVVLATTDAADGVGTMYRVTRPMGGNDGVAKVLANAGGEPIELALPGAIIGRTIPGEPRRWNDAEAFYFSEGASVFDGSAPARVTRVTAEGWSAVEIVGGATAAFAPELFIRVDNGFFWAPNYEPELIYPDAGDPSSWTRTPLPDAPRPESTPILSSAGDWVYYDSTNDEALAYNVKTNDVVAFADSTWIGASFESEIGEEIRTELIAHQQIAAVLVHLGDNRIGAVEAADPQAGVVILGELPSTTETVQANGPAMGPARLLRVEHEDGGVEIVAVDTRESGSLRRIMETPAVAWSYAASIGPTAIEVDVDPGATAPLPLF